MSPKRMDLQIIRTLLSGLPVLGGDHTFCLHGGEPLLIGKTWFAQLVELVTRHNIANEGKSFVSITVQTNAMLVDPEWVSLFQKGQIGVSLSLDGPVDVHDHARLSRNRHGTHAKVRAAIDALCQGGVRLGALAVLTKRTLELGPARFYDYFRTVPLANGLDVNPYIETGLSPIELTAKNTHEPEPEKLTRFLCDLFDVWLFDVDMGHKVDIRMFEQLTGVALGFIPSLCSLTQGASCGKTPSIMPNGDVYACDLEVNGLNFRMGSLLSESIAEICAKERLNILHEKIMAGLKLRGCTTCDFSAYCGLTCPRHTFSSRDHSPYCTMMEALVTHAKTRLNDIARQAYNENIEFSS